MFEALTREVEQFFEGLAKSVDEAADSLMELTEEITDQIQAAIAPELDQLGQHLDEWVDPLLQAILGFESAVSDAAEPFTHTVEPIFNEHPACVGCRHYHGQSYNGVPFVCAMHPYGWDSDANCPDWETVWPHNNPLDHQSR